VRRNGSKMTADQQYVRKVLPKTVITLKGHGMTYPLHHSPKTTMREIVCESRQYFRWLIWIFTFRNRHSTDVAENRRKTESTYLLWCAFAADASNEFSSSRPKLLRTSNTPFFFAACNCCDFIICLRLTPAGTLLTSTVRGQGSYLVRMSR
jgi:hypothetical protein